MFVDALLLLSDNQALVATGNSTNTIDLGNPTVKNRIGNGEPMAIGVQVGVAADFTTGDESYEIDIVTSATPDLATPTRIAKYVLTAAQLALFKRFILPIPPGLIVQRYLGLNYVLGGTTPSVTLRAELGPMSFFDGETTIYAKGYSN
jgi:hypothetical protein